MGRGWIDGRLRWRSGDYGEERRFEWEDWISDEEEENRE